MLTVGQRVLKRRHLLVATAGALAIAAPAMAQETRSSVVEELVVTAPNYVATTNVAATKVAIPLIETPQSISVVTRDQIDLLNLQNLQQVVRYTSGVVGENFGSDERYDWLTLRGFNPVEYIDGLQAPVGSVSNVGLDLWGAQSVEILKGPSGVLYGQTPPGGLVNITMRRPQADFSAEAQAQYGSYEDKQVAGDITGTLMNGVEGRLTGLWRDRQTQTDFVKSKRTFIAPAVTFHMAPDTDMTLLAYYQKDRVSGDGGGFLPTQGTLLPNPNVHLGSSFNAGEPTYNVFRREQYGIGYEFNHTFNSALSFHQNAKYSTSQSYSQSVYGAGIETDLRTLDRYNFVFPENIKQFAVDSRLEAHGSTGAIEHVALLGVDYRNLTNRSDFGFAFGPTLDLVNPVYGVPVTRPALFPYLRQRQQQTGIYAQDEMKLDHWRLTLSARQDWLDTRNSGVSVSDQATTYRVGVNYVFDSGLAPYASYSTSFLPVSGADFNGNPFVPSTGKQVEVGVKFEPRNLPRDVKIFTSAAVYDLTQQHVITQDPNPSHAFFSIQTGEVQVKGVELEGIARIHERLSLNGDYSYTDSEVTKSNGPDLHKQLPIVPRHKASLFADYTQQTGPLAGLGGGVGVRYQSAFYGDPANTLQSRSQVLVDALLHYNIQEWKVSLNASNLLDKNYVQHCAAVSQCFYGARRILFVTIGRKW
ncbi:TonB-dependent siderophore receptor [Phenylobacterium hankyongense]|uniref:TonB-dependent siderophore receptor n=1 Tax=Phenylobacterium hankyongense TaxID=1813876 RepID=A0A328B596_9CAUL|nr:TonB-dependent siderophore receptor [Phenylobacterium hankyongense]RAK60218.1 TonB-dependent siderophore receptor [Phenylobacterium hankyongense]